MDAALVNEIILNQQQPQPAPPADAQAENANALDIPPPPPQPPPPNQVPQAPVQAARQPQQVQQRQRQRNPNFTQEECVNFLLIMEEILPIGPHDWDRVASNHAATFPGRDVNSLRRKYTSLYRRTIPTGDPNCPEEVRLAKKVMRDIGDRAAVGVETEHFELSSGTFTNNPSNVANPNISNRNSRTSSNNATNEGPPRIEASSSSTTAVSQPAAPSPLSVAPSINLTHTPRGGRGSSTRMEPSSFLELYQMQMLNELKMRQEDRKERAEERRHKEEVREKEAKDREDRREKESKDFKEMFLMAMGGISNGMRKNERKRRRYNSDSSASSGGDRK